MTGTKSFPLSLDLKSITEKIVSALQPEKIILFGSAVRGDSDQYSDIDLLIIKKTDQPFLRRLKDFPILPIRSDVFIYTPEEFDRMREEGNIFLEQALENSKVLYTK
jgi:uncharacterized protein